MKTDKDYSYISVCPVTKDQLSNGDLMHSNGICPRCGHDDNSTITHEEKIVGKWVRPTFFEKLMGHRKYFIHKEK